eukprot:246536_1
MTKKFGPRAIRSNSDNFGDAMSPTQRTAWLAMEQQRVSTDLTLDPALSPSFHVPDNCRAPMTPVFVHPIPNPNGDPLDFSHLRTCFVIFQSQSQANNFVKSRARAMDGIKSLHQYEYIKYQKTQSMNKARGISPLISPNSIGLALNSPTYAIIGSTKHANKNKQEYQQPYEPYAQDMYPPAPSPMMQPLPMAHISNMEASAHAAMEFYLQNYNAGTPMLIVPAPVADAMAHEFSNKLNSAPLRSRNQWKSRVNERHSWNDHGNNYANSGARTWSHKQRYSEGQGNYGRFDFDQRRSSSNHGYNQRRSGGYKRNQRNGHRYGGSKTTTYRHMKASWRNAGNHEARGAIPPAPTPNYFKANKQGSIGVASRNYVKHYAVKDNRNKKHQSPAMTPKIASINAPHNTDNTMPRATY